MSVDLKEVSESILEYCWYQDLEDRHERMRGDIDLEDAIRSLQFILDTVKENVPLHLKRVIVHFSEIPEITIFRNEFEYEREERLKQEEKLRNSELALLKSLMEKYPESVHEHENRE